jgi:hypothetical protein
LVPNLQQNTWKLTMGGDVFFFPVSHWGL